MFIAGQAFAEDEIVKDKIYNLKIRAIQGMVSEVDKNPEGSGNQLSDIKSNLDELGFKSYKMFDTKIVQIHFETPTSVIMSNGDTLTFKHFRSDAGRICMWFKWIGSDGMQILDTKLHFDAQESVITGTEDSSNSGVIFAINVE